MSQEKNNRYDYFCSDGIELNSDSCFRHTSR